MKVYELMAIMSNMSAGSDVLISNIDEDEPFVVLEKEHIHGGDTDDIAVHIIFSTVEDQEEETE